MEIYSYSSIIFIDNIFFMNHLNIFNFQIILKFDQNSENIVSGKIIIKSY